MGVPDVNSPQGPVVADPAAGGQRSGDEEPAQLPDDGALRQRPAARREGDRDADDRTAVARYPDPPAVADRAGEDPREGDAIGEAPVAAAAWSDRRPDRVVEERVAEDAGR
jgi:hypothetical protein